MSHQQHGFLSVTYTQAVTKNVRHKLTTRQERGGRGAQRLTEGPADGSPQYLREILLTAQPFDVVLSCPLLATVAGVFQVTLPRRYRDRGRSAGQPMRSHILTSRSLPLIYINTSVIRIFCPGTQDKEAPAGEGGYGAAEGRAVLAHLPFLAALFASSLATVFA